MPKREKRWTDRHRHAEPYPWEEWFGKDEVTLRRGKDFTCYVHSMIQQVKNKAGKLGLKVSVYASERDVRVVVRHRPRRGVATNV